MKRTILLLGLVLLGLLVFTGCSHEYYHDQDGRDGRRHNNRYYRGDRDRYDRRHNTYYHSRPYRSSGIGIRVGVW